MDIGISPHLGIRPLAAIENLFAAYSEVGAMTFCIAATVTGGFNIERFRRAAADVQRRHGLLRVGIQRNSGYFRSFFSTDAPIPVEIKPIADGDWEAEAAREINRPFNVHQGPLARFVGLRLRPDLTYVIATFHHAIADGLSGVLVIRDLMRALGGHALVALEETESMDSLLGDSLSAMLATTDLPLAPPGIGQNPWGADVNRLATVRSLTLDRTLTANLESRSRSNGTTVHGILCSAVTKVFSDVSAGDSELVRIMSPVNMRSVLGGTEQCGLFMSAAVVPHKYSGDLWEDARRSRDSLSLYRGKEAALAISAIATTELALNDSADFARSAMWRYVDYDVMVTNLGRVQIDRTYGNLSLEHISGPIVRCCVKGENVIGASTFQGVLTLVHTTVDGPVDLVERIEDALREL